MTLKELKAKATATEACLIEKIETEMRREIRDHVLVQVIKFIDEHPAPSRQDLSYNRQSARTWLNNLKNRVQGDETRL